MQKLQASLQKWLYQRLIVSDWNSVRLYKAYFSDRGERKSWNPLGLVPSDRKLDVGVDSLQRLFDSAHRMQKMCIDVNCSVYYLHRNILHIINYEVFNILEILHALASEDTTIEDKMSISVSIYLNLNTSGSSCQFHQVFSIRWTSC